LSTKKKKERPLSFINWHSLGFILEIEENLVNMIFRLQLTDSSERRLARLATD
jgi:hypothetical protein